MLEVPLIGFVPPAERDAFRRALVEEYWSERGVTHPDDFARQKRVRLGEAVLGRARVYLDTNFWIDLRKAAHGEPPTAAHGELLRVLRALFAAGTAVCPLTEPAILELLKQKSRDARIASARLVDELSGGVALQPHEARLRSELLHFVRRYGPKKADLYPFEQMAWTRTSFVFGDVMPTSAIPELDSDAVCASFDDYAWTISLEEMVGALPEFASPLTALDQRGLAHRLTEGKFTHADDVRTFRDAYKAEVAGAVDAHGDLIDDVGPYLFERETGRPAPAQDAARGNPMLRKLIIAALRKDPKRRDLPTINIQAGIHAAMRCDRTRTFKPSDWLDFMHATAALPYCSLFLTDRSLATLLTCGPLDYENQFDCRVEHDSTRGIEALAELTCRSS